MFIQFAAFDTITAADEVARVRQAFTAQVRHIRETTRVYASGIFTDARAGFFLVEVDSAEDLFDLLSPSMYDAFHIETHPVMGFDQLVEFFRRDTTA